MSMLGTRLGTQIWTTIKALQTYSPAITPAQDAAGLALWQAIATDIVAEVTGHAVVTATGADPQGGSVDSTGTVS